MTVRANAAVRPIALLYVTTVSSTVRHFLRPYADHFRALGWRVDAAANGASADAVIRDAFERVFELPLSRSIRDVAGMARSVSALHALLGADDAPDIVHVHTPIAGFVARLAAAMLPRGRRPAVIYTAHGFHFHSAGHPVTNTLFRESRRSPVDGPIAS